jgi:uncharacterized protein (DUF2267 family)
MSANRYD